MEISLKIEKMLTNIKINPNKYFKTNQKVQKILIKLFGIKKAIIIKE